MLPAGAATMKRAEMKHPWPVTGRSPQVESMLDRFAVLLPPEPKHRDPLQHDDCHWIAGTIGCLEVGGSMCLACGWWLETSRETP